MDQVLKVLIVEDSLAGIKTAKMQFGKHDLQIFATMEQFRHGCREWYRGNRPDVILTDLNVRWGEMGGTTHGMFDKDTLIPLGFVVSLLAVKLGIPCFIITDSNGHHDATGLLLEETGFGAVQGNTRPLMTYTTHGQGKDWIASIPCKEWRERLGS